MKILFLFFFFVPGLARAYPVMFKCDSKGKVKQELTPQELSDQLVRLITSINKLPLDQRTKKINEVSAYGKSCIADVRSLLTLSALSNLEKKSEVNVEISRILERAKEKSFVLEGFMKQQNGSSKHNMEMEQITESIALSYECRISSLKLQDKKVVNGKYCHLGNFKHTPYTYVTGSRDSGVKDKTVKPYIASPTLCQDIEDFVKTSVASGQDPYAAMAITLMENSTSISALYLDPIGSVQTLGCGFKRATAENNNLDSFGTYYNVKYGLIKNDFVLKNIDNVLKLKKIEMEPGTSYYCAGGKRGQDATIGDLPDSDRCCIKLPYGKKGVSLESGLRKDIDPMNMIEKSLTMASLEKYLKPGLSPKTKSQDAFENSARRLQRFNGWSDSMGGAESVSSWRTGVNLYTHPMYGLQAMDFVLNSLTNNPYMNSVVKKAEDELGKSSPSIMCMDLKPGTYSIDHDYFSSKVAKAPRMTSILARWRKNRSWRRSSGRDRSVLRKEISQSCKLAGLVVEFCNLPHTSMESEEFDKTATEAVDKYFAQAYASRATIELANEMEEGFTWKPMNELHLKIMINNVEARINKQGQKP